MRKTEEEIIFWECVCMCVCGGGGEKIKIDPNAEMQTHRHTHTLSLIIAIFHLSLYFVLVTLTPPLPCCRSGMLEVLYANLDRFDEFFLSRTVDQLGLLAHRRPLFSVTVHQTMLDAFKLMCSQVRKGYSTKKCFRAFRWFEAMSMCCSIYPSIQLRRRKEAKIRVKISI